MFNLVYFCFQAYGGGFFLSKLLSLGLLPNFDLANGEEEEEEGENAEDGGGMVVSANKCTHFLRENVRCVLFSKNRPSETTSFSSSSLCSLSSPKLMENRRHQTDSHLILKFQKYD